MPQVHTKTRQYEGFTLVELLMAMLIAGIVLTGVYSVYSVQQKSYYSQQDLIQLQGKLRTAIHFMEREISMAGCDPTGNSGAGIVVATGAMIRVQEDVDGDGDASEYSEDITYGIYTSSDGTKKLGRKSPVTANYQPVVQHVDVVDFVYLDEDGQVLSSPVSDTRKIRSVQVTVLVRAEKEDPSFIDTTTYKNQQGTIIFGPANDHFHRRIISLEILCRNLSF